MMVGVRAIAVFADADIKPCHLDGGGIEFALDYAARWPRLTGTENGERVVGTDRDDVVIESLAAEIVILRVLDIGPIAQTDQATDVIDFEVLQRPVCRYIGHGTIDKRDIGNEGGDGKFDDADIVLRIAAGKEPPLVVREVLEKAPASAAIQRFIKAVIPGEVNDARANVEYVAADRSK